MEIKHKETNPKHNEKESKKWANAYLGRKRWGERVFNPRFCGCLECNGPNAFFFPSGTNSNLGLEVRIYREMRSPQAAHFGVDSFTVISAVGGDVSVRKIEDFED